MGGFAQEDIPSGSKPNPLESEKCAPGGPTIEPAHEGWQAHDRQGRNTSGPQGEAVKETDRCHVARK
jgi:hypothetical protein